MVPKVLDSSNMVKNDKPIMSMAPAVLQTEESRKMQEMKYKTYTSEIGKLEGTVNSIVSSLSGGIKPDSFTENQYYNTMTKYYDLAQKYLPNGTCGVMCFGIKGGRDKSIAFMDNLKFASICTHVADAKTCVLHPASHTHRQLTDEQLIEAGIAPDLIRFSVGMEDPDDIIADIEQALNKI